MESPAPPLERRAVVTAAVAALVFFLIMAAYYVLKPARLGIFLDVLGPRWIPAFYVINAVVCFGAAWLFGRLADVVSKRYLLTGIQGVFVAVILAFWLLLRCFPLGGPPTTWTVLVSAALTLWVNVFVLFSVTPFWSLVNDLFAPAQGRRLYGAIGAGGVLGGLAGGFVVKYLVDVVGTVNLLPISAGLLALTVPCLLALLNVVPPGGGPQRGDGRAGEGSGGLAGLLLVGRNQYVRQIAIVVVYTTFAQTIVDYQFSVAVAAAIPGLDARTSYVAAVQMGYNLVSLAVQVLVTPLLLQRLGVGAALAILPATAVAGALATLHGAGLEPLSVIYVVTFAALYSVNQASKELLYVPCMDDVKYKAKAFIDIFGYRLGPAVCGLVLLAGTSAGVAAASYSVLVMAVVVDWGRRISTLAGAFAVQARAADQRADAGP